MKDHDINLSKGALLTLLSQSRADNDQLRQLLEQSQSDNKKLQDMMQTLQSQLDKLQRMMFGQRSERQCNLKTKETAGHDQKENKKHRITTDKKMLNKNGRRKLPEELPRKVLKHDFMVHAIS